MTSTTKLDEDGIRAAVEGAADPLDEARATLKRVVQKVAVDPGAPLEAEALEAAALVEEHDPPEFARFLDQLPSRKGLVKRLNDELANKRREKQAATGGASNRAPQAERLIGLVRQHAELFNDGDLGHAVIRVRRKNTEHKQVWPLRSRDFKTWLSRQFFEQEGKAANSEAVAAALNTVEGIARFDSPEHKVHLRIAGHNEKAYLDLGDPLWRAVEIDANGWHIIADPIERGVYFRRSRGMLSLPDPQSGGSISELRKFVNANSEDDFRLQVAWLIGAIQPCGPYPILILHGEQGCAKSTTARVLRDLIDPNRAPLHSDPRDVRDLMIGANNRWIMAFDNLSFIPAWLSDALCRLATGGGYATRELYANQEEVIFDAQRPIILTGIEELATRSDLLDRSLINWLSQIPADRRRPEKELNMEFEAAWPALVGAILDAASCALRKFDRVTLKNQPRMADFAKWNVAAEPALPWRCGSFLNAYAGNRESANVLALEASVIYQALTKMHLPFEGTASELLDDLKQQLPDKDRPPKRWPGDARAMSNHLRRIAPNLRQTGIEVEFVRSNRKRLIRITEAPFANGEGETASPASPVACATQPEEKTAENGLPDPGPSDVSDAKTPKLADRAKDNDTEWF